MPENLYMGLDDGLRLGHLTLAVDQLSDRPKSRTGGRTSGGEESGGCPQIGGGGGQSAV
jgi:hypothetical protein